MEVFPWAVDALVGFLLVLCRTRTGNLADVGEGVEQSEFGLDQVRVIEGQAATKRVVLREQHACPVGAHVVTGDQRAEFVEPREGLGARVRVLAPRLGTKLNARRGLGRRTFTGLVEAQQCSARIDLVVDRGEDLPNTSRGWCAQSRFHLHALQDHERGTGLDLVARGHRHRNDHGRRRGSDETRFVLTDAVAYAVHLDEESSGARDRDDMEALVA